MLRPDADAPTGSSEGKGTQPVQHGLASSTQIGWKAIYLLDCPPLEALLLCYGQLYEEGLSTLKGYGAKLYVEASTVPKFCKARPVPHAMRIKVEKELKRLVEAGILEPIQCSDWTAPIVPVLRKDLQLFAYVSISK